MKLSFVFATTLSSCSIIALTAFGFCNQATAFTISGKARGEWVNPILDKQHICFTKTLPNCFITGVGTNSFSWGELPKNIPPNETNQLVFAGNFFSGDVGSWLKIGNLKYFNGINYFDTNVEYVTLNLDLTFGDTVQANKVLPVSFKLVNTLNSGTNIKDPANADSVVFDTGFAKTNFTLGNNTYQFELLGFSPLSQTSISALEGEQSNDPGDIYAKVTVSSSIDVPEAPTIAGSLLAGMYLIYRQKFLRAKIK
ncbi:MAG: choice-of-anchor K domain-containing protein [Mojavia pulchra JT2-VF2]|jgi:hypothetical protein|uniref:Choice-of-anchor K domain-containing protein n=1 Tax=Mojavia pulchra JT2-VF2 TaxID=287848 RepID=A0A951Q4L5_9NOST|nr:choice-of-anchor K domain-containing protein [Mojavia pulchra JT2-VF2]